MSLTARQCRTLDSIGQQLGAREPRLASMFAMFARLTKDERLPSVETIEAQRSQWLAELTDGVRRRQRRRRLRAITRRRTTTRYVNVAFVPFIVIGLLAIAIAVGGHGLPTNRCGLVIGYHAAGIANIGSSRCRPSPSHP